MSGFKITSIWAYISVDPVDGDEGILAFQSGYGTMPMIAADKRRLDQLRPMAEAIAQDFGIEVHLVRFDNRSNVEILPTQKESEMPEHAGAAGAAHNASIRVEEDGLVSQPTKNVPPQDVAMSEVGRKNEKADNAGDTNDDSAE